MEEEVTSQLTAHASVVVSLLVFVVLLTFVEAHSKREEEGTQDGSGYRDHNHPQPLPPIIWRHDACKNIAAYTCSYWVFTFALLGFDRFLPTG